MIPVDDAPVTRRLVYLESPFAGDRVRNAAYLKAAMRDSIARGEAPFASHAMYVQFLDDNVSEERAMGIEAGLAWGLKAKATVVYMDLGISPGMRLGIDRAHEAGRPVEQRILRWTYEPGARRDASVEIPPAIEWHRNKQSRCESCGACVPVGTPHRALTWKESKASEVVTEPHNGFGFAVGYAMNAVLAGASHDAG